MKRRNFFKSFAVLLGVAIVAPLELFKNKKECYDAPKLDRYVKDEISQYGYIPVIKQGLNEIEYKRLLAERNQADFYKNFDKFIVRSKPSGELWDWDKIEHYKELLDKSNPVI